MGWGGRDPQTTHWALSPGLLDVQILQLPPPPRWVVYCWIESENTKPGRQRTPYPQVSPSSAELCYASLSDTLEICSFTWKLASHTRCTHLGEGKIETSENPPGGVVAATWLWGWTYSAVIKHLCKALWCMLDQPDLTSTYTTHLHSGKKEEPE